MSAPKRARRGRTPRIELRAGEVHVPIRRTGALAAQAIDWCFALAQRPWWNRAGRRRAHMADVARATLIETLGVAEPELTTLASAYRAELLLEVVLPDGPEIPGAREFPWEYVLAAATGVEDGELPPTVTRCIVPDTPPSAPRRRRRVLYVENLPGEYAGLYQFDVERELPDLLGAAEIWDEADVSLAQLRATVRDLQPDVIHLAGIDTHQACILRDEPINPDRADDGLILAASTGAVEVSAREVGRALCAGRRKPQLVVFNVHNSAAHLAAEAVRAGAQAAIGFQHAVDDAVAELFLAELYRMWGRRGLPLVAALIAARERLHGYGASFSGTGFVLWTRGSQQGVLSEVEEQTIIDHVGERRETPLALSEGAWRDDVRVDVRPYDQLNYVLLHNQHPLFRRFTIRKIPDGVLRDVAIETTLQIGGATFRSEMRASLTSRLHDFRSRVRIPLTWNLDELPTERVQTTLTTRVRCGNVELAHESFPVHLQTVDLWVDDDANRQWLPSFVLPRDAAVARVVDAAQRYLIALTDDVVQGFDGYQSVDPKGADPYGVVDAQVQAIWTTLVQDFQLRYVNPPPSFEVMAQRLRSPSDVIDGRRGTCIDLALLLAACLEHVEIYPAVFLLEGHAFVGYWRSEEGYDDFVDQVLLWPGPDRDLDPDHGKPPHRRRTRYGTGLPDAAYPWIYGADFYRSVFSAVQGRQQLVPLEATGIPRLLGFWEAVDEGAENLRSIHDFHSLVDVPAARDHGVTPLPFRRNRS